MEKIQGNNRAFSEKIQRNRPLDTHQNVIADILNIISPGYEFMANIKRRLNRGFACRGEGRGRGELLSGGVGGVNYGVD